MKQKAEAQRGQTADQDSNLAHLAANDSSIAVPQVTNGTRQGSASSLGFMPPSQSIFL